MDPITLIILVLLVLIVFGNVVYVPQDMNHGGILWALFIVLMIVLIWRIAKGGRPLVLLAALAALAMNACTGNPPKQISHSESESRDWTDSGKTKSEKTVTATPDGGRETETKTITKVPPPSN